jgi:hypothetical protein
MGLLIDFFAGDAKLIGARIESGSASNLRPGTTGVVAHADFALHLSLENLDTLGAVIAERSGIECLPLLFGLESLGPGSEWSSTNLVCKSWVRMVASREEDESESLTAQWIGRIGEEIGEDLTITPDAIVSVRSLIALCRRATDENLDVVLWWSL